MRGKQPQSITVRHGARTLTHLFAVDDEGTLYPIGAGVAGVVQDLRLGDPRMIEIRRDDGILMRVFISNAPEESR